MAGIRKVQIISSTTSIYKSQLSRHISLFTAVARPLVEVPLNKVSKGPVNRKNHWER